jgi:transposase
MKRKSYTREFKIEEVKLITEKGYSIAEASRNLGVEYSVPRRWKGQFSKDSSSAFPGKGHLSPQDEELRRLKAELEKTKEARDILKKAVAYFAKEQK